MTAADLLANVERSDADRPAAALPPVPDLVPDERPWHGGAVAERDYWRCRALCAEKMMRALAKALARYRVVP